MAKTVNIIYFDNLTLPGGVTLKKKYTKISRFKKLSRENDHNSLNIRDSALKLVAFNAELNFD